MHDLTTIVRLKSEERAAGVYQDYETLRLAIAEALGGTNDNSTDSDTVETFSDLASAFTALGGSLG